MRARGMCLLLGFVLLAAGAAFGGAAGATPGRVSGRVVHAATGRAAAKVTLLLARPLSRAETLDAAPDPEILTTVSGGGGRFTFRRVPPGAWALCVRDKTVAGASGDCLFELEPGGHAKKMEVRVNGGGCVEGGVYLDEDFARGLANVTVTVTAAPDNYNDVKILPAYSAITDAGGQYRITGLPAGELEVALMPGHGYQMASPVFVDDSATNRGVELRAGKTLKRVEFQAAPAYRVAGTVTDTSGKPVPGALGGAFRSFGEPPYPLAVTGREGGYVIRDLQRPEAFLGAAGGGCFSPPVPCAAVPATENAPGEPCAITVYRPARVGGTVVGADGNPLAVAELAIILGTDEKRVEVDKSGRFDTKDIMCGEYLFRVGLDYRHRTDNQPEIDQPVSVKEGEHLDNATLTYPHAAGTAQAAGEPQENKPGEMVWISGRVVDTEGKPVRAYVLGRSPVGGGRVEANTDENGGFRMELLKGPPDSLLRLGVCAGGYVEQAVACPGTASGHLDFTLEKAPEAVFKVLDDATGKPVREYVLNLERVAQDEVWRGSFPGRNTKVRAEDGVFRRTLSPGDWKVRVTVPGYLPASTVQRVLPDRENLVSMRLKKEGGIRGVVRDTGGRPVAGAEVKIAPDPTHQNGLSAKTDNKGRFSFARVGSGRTTLEVFHELYSKTAPVVEVKQGKTAKVKITLNKPGSIAGRVTVAGKPVCDASVGFMQNGMGGARTDTQGRYTIDAVDTGEQVLSVSVPESPDFPHGRRLKRKVKIEPEKTTTYDVAFEPGECRLEGESRLFGAPAWGVIFLSVTTKAGDRESFVLRGREDGSFSFTGLPAGRAVASCVVEKRKSSGHEFVLSKDQPVRQIFDRVQGVTISGKVTGFEITEFTRVFLLYGTIDRKELDAAPISIMDPRGMGGSLIRADGSFQIDNAQPGPATLAVCNVPNRGLHPWEDVNASTLTPIMVGSEPISGIVLSALPEAPK